MSTNRVSILHRIKYRAAYEFRKRTAPVSNFKDKQGIEIGGPSPFFGLAEFPVYHVIKNLDGCNFATNTVWEGSIKEGENNYKYYAGQAGYQHVKEASDLSGIESNKYDFVLACHCLEHCANPIKAVKEWLRVIKQKGLLLLILPDKRYTFDHNRPVTSFEHLVSDFENNTDETDLTHLDEILKLHDLSMDLPAGDTENFKQRSLNNYQNRCLHHHVFDFDLLGKLFRFCNIREQYRHLIPPYHQLIIGVKQ